MSGDCIVVGGRGFVGHAVTRRLAAQGRRVVVIDRTAAPAAPAASCDRVVHLRADIRDLDALRNLAGACPPTPWVINLAARQYQDAMPRRHRLHWFADVNVDGAVNVCRFAADMRAAGLVQFSTDMVYGLPRAVPVTEEHVRHPLGEYGISKMHMEDRMRECADAHALPLTIFRPRLIAGAGRLGVFTRLFSLIRRHLPVPLIGDGRNAYQMVAVEDCATAVLCALDKGCPNTAYNLGSRPTLCVYDLLRELVAAVKSQSRIVPTPAGLARGTLRALAMIGIEPLYPEQYQLADRNFVADITKAETELGWRPQRRDLELMIDAWHYWERVS